jgi:hypothetical protein
MGEPAWTGLGRAQVAGWACVICAQRLSTGQDVVVGRCGAGSPVLACAGVCTARALCLADVHTSTGGVTGGGVGG